MQHLFLCYLYLSRINSGRVHPAFIKLGVQMKTCAVVGSNSRCLAFLYALKQVCKNYYVN